MLLAQVAQVAAGAQEAPGAGDGEHHADDEDDGDGRAGEEDLPFVVDAGDGLAEGGEVGRIGVVHDDPGGHDGGRGEQEQSDERHVQISSAVTPEGERRCTTMPDAKPILSDSP
ncbi:hypothetical protein [Actinomadura physcomitrii]|uniref:hypothetical protein n=1 Tax=Actinomadura physcomitrii TaxID=2650748 RepID=UPI001F359FA4|nr:hypothetical protein [Actinomadura physcomitrii]